MTASLPFDPTSCHAAARTKCGAFARALLASAALSLACPACGGDAGPEPEAGGKAGEQAAASKPSKNREAPEADATRVEVAVLQHSNAELISVLPGEVEGSRDATLASAQGGPIDRISVKEGDIVRRGQLLAQLDTALYGIRKKQVETELSKATRDLDRAKGLGTALSTAERDRRQASVDILETNLELAALQLRRSTVRAPFAGVISEVFVEVGEVVPAAAPLMRLVKLDPVQVVLSVPDRDVVALSAGADVTIDLAAVPGEIKGKIARVSPTSDPETRAFRVEVEVDNKERRVLPGMIATARIAGSLASGAVVIPQDWLVTRRDGVGVFLDEQGVAKYRPVTAGKVVREQVIIDHGLAKGDRLIMTGHRGLADGDLLVVTREGVCCQDGRPVY